MNKADPWLEFLKWEQISRDTIDFKTIYVDMADDLIAGLLLSQIVYWYLPDKKGQSKLRVFKDGYYWIAKTRTEWWDEIRVKARQIDRALKILEKRGIIVSHLYRFNNAPTTHIRIDKEGFLTAWNTALSQFNETVKSELSDPFSPNLQFDLTDSSNPNDEMVKSDLPESVKSLTKTTIDFSEIITENTSDFSDFPNPPDPDPAPEAREEPSDDEPLDAGTDLYWQHCREAEANQKAGGNYADPDSFSLGDRLITVACARLGRSEPQGDKRKNALAFFEKALKAEGLLQGDVAMLKKAVKDWLDPEGEYAFFLPQYELTTKHELALRHLGIMLSKAKKAADAGPDRRSRYDTPSVRASQAAFDERKAARPRPAKDDKVGQAVKRELELQMSKPTYQTYVQRSGMVCDDGVLTVTAPDATIRGWLADRLATTIRRTAVGVVGRPVEVRFETK